MTTMGFLRNNTKASAKMAQDSLFSIEPGKHLYISGSTGSGKTRLLGKMLRTEIHSENKKGILVVDEKNVLHREIKHIANDPSRIYQIGAPAYGANDIRINLLELACPSPNKAQEFFRMQITSKSHGNNSGSTDFWANAAAKMAYSTYLFVSSLKNLLVYARQHSDIPEDQIVIRKNVEIGKKEKETCFFVNPEPLVFSELYLYFSDPAQFKIISEHGNDIVMSAERLMRRCFPPSHLTREIAGILDGMIKELRERAVDMGQYHISDDASEASGHSGVWFTIQSSLPASMKESPVLNEKHPTHDIVSLLEEGNIVIIDSENTDKTVVGMILNSVWDSLSLRSHDRHARPVVCFVEEAPRVLNPEIKLEETLAFARESRLSLVLIAQGDSQIKSIYGEQKTESILNNVEPYRLSGKDAPMEKFTFLYRDELYRFEPDFTDEANLLSAELTYQRHMGQYDGVERNENEVVVYNDRLYSRSQKVAIVDCDTLRTRTVAYRTESDCIRDAFTEIYLSHAAAQKAAVHPEDEPDIDNRNEDEDELEIGIELDPNLFNL